MCGSTFGNYLMDNSVNDFRRRGRVVHHKMIKIEQAALNPRIHYLSKNDSVNVIKNELSRRVEIWVPPVLGGE